MWQVVWRAAPRSALGSCISMLSPPRPFFFLYATSCTLNQQHHSLPPRVPESPVCTQRSWGTVVRRLLSSVVFCRPSSSVVRCPPSSAVVRRPPSSSIVRRPPSSSVVLYRPPSSVVLCRPPSSVVLCRPPSSVVLCRAL